MQSEIKKAFELFFNESNIILSVLCQLKTKLPSVIQLLNQENDDDLLPLLNRLYV